jgi:hypothetical protein
MRVLALWSCLLGLLGPGQAMALGAEDTEYLGLVAGERVVKLSLLTTQASATKPVLAYGTASPGLMAYCWQQNLNELPQAFVCAAGPGAVPTLVYGVVRTGADLPAALQAEYSLLALKAGLGSGQRRGDGSLLTSFVCRQGCRADLPRHLFAVGHFD